MDGRNNDAAVWYLMRYFATLFPKTIDKNNSFDTDQSESTSYYQTPLDTTARTFVHYGSITEKKVDDDVEELPIVPAQPNLLLCQLMLKGFFRSPNFEPLKSIYRWDSTRCREALPLLIYLRVRYSVTNLSPDMHEHVIGDFIAELSAALGPQQAAAARNVAVDVCKLFLRADSPQRLTPLELLDIFEFIMLQGIEPVVPNVPSPEFSSEIVESCKTTIVEFLNKTKGSTKVKIGYVPDQKIRIRTNGTLRFHFVYL